MNELYMKSVIKDRQREVNKLVEHNRINRYYRDAARSQLDSNEKSKKGLSLLLMVAKRLKSIFTIENRGRVKV